MPDIKVKEEWWVRFKRRSRWEEMNEGSTKEQKVGKKDAAKTRKRETKSILNRGEDSSKTRTRIFFLSAKRWKKVNGTKTVRTKDGKRELGGMERFHTEIRNGRFRRAPISQWCECRRFVPLRHYKERFTWLHISPVVVGALRMFYSAAHL